MTYKEKTKDIYKMIGQGQLMEAFEKYYVDNVVITEPRGTFEPKNSCREHEVQFIDFIAEFHGMKVKAITSDEEKGIVIHETNMDITFKDGNRVVLEQAGVQRWEG